MLHILEDHVAVPRSQLHEDIQVGERFELEGITEMGVMAYCQYEVTAIKKGIAEAIQVSEPTMMTFEQKVEALMKMMSSRR